MNKRFIFTMKNRDGKREKLTIEARSLSEATNTAIEEANSGHLQGTGWVVYHSREVK